METGYQLILRYEDWLPDPDPLEFIRPALEALGVSDTDGSYSYWAAEVCLLEPDFILHFH